LTISTQTENVNVILVVDYHNLNSSKSKTLVVEYHTILKARKLLH